MNGVNGDSAGRVVVGYDGGWRMQNLLRVAAEDAERRQANLAIVTVSRPALDPALADRGRRSAEHRAEAAARRHLTRAADYVRARHQQLLVTTHHLTEEQARTGTYPLSSADLLAVGTVGQHGRRVFSEDSVSRILLRAARCPVLVVPHDVPIPSRLHRHRTVTAGIGEASSGAASRAASEAGLIQAARAESMRRGCGLELFHAFCDRPEESSSQALARAAETVARAVAAAGIALGENDSVVLSLAGAAEALTRQAREAELLVIGSRPGSLAGPVQGSVGLEIIGSLHCPLLVIPEPAPDRWSRHPVAQLGG